MLEGLTLPKLSIEQQFYIIYLTEKRIDLSGFNKIAEKNVVLQIEAHEARTMRPHFDLTTTSDLSHLFLIKFTRSNK